MVSNIKAMPAFWKPMKSERKNTEKSLTNSATGYNYISFGLNENNRMYGKHKLDWGFAN